MQHFITGIVDALSHLVSAFQYVPVAQVVLALTLSGGAATAILQLFKDLTPIRHLFQKLWLHRWLTKRLAAFDLKSKADKLTGFDELELNKIKNMIVELATGGDKKAFYALPSDRLVAQLNAAAQSALDYPGNKFYYQVVAILSQGVSMKDLAVVASESSARVVLGRTSGHGTPAAPVTNYVDARTRLANRIQRNLDGMQISLGNCWQFFLQFMAFLTSTAVFEIALVHSQHHDRYDVGVALGIGFLASYLSPVFNDIIKALQSLKKS